MKADLRRPDLSHAIFDFDGTLSWLRHGWPRAMLDVCLGYAPPEWRDNPRLQKKLLGEILSLNGKPSIHQIRRFCELMGPCGRTLSPEVILGEYQSALREIVQQRIAAARRESDGFLIAGTRRVLTALQNRKVTLMILSGTLETDVRQEAELLGLTFFFGRHIYGSPLKGDFSKKDVIRRIMREEHIEGRQLLAFGDGPVEIASTKAVGGLAIGVASDEEQNGSHQIDPIKREHLIAAGADAVIPDYVDVEVLLAEIFRP